MQEHLDNTVYSTFPKFGSKTDPYKHVRTCILAMTVALAILKRSAPDRFLVFLPVSIAVHSLLCSLSHTYTTYWRHHATDRQSYAAASTLSLANSSSTEQLETLNDVEARLMSKSTTQGMRARLLCTA